MAFFIYFLHMVELSHFMRDLGSNPSHSMLYIIYTVSYIKLYVTVRFGTPSQAQIRSAAFLRPPFFYIFLQCLWKMKKLELDRSCSEEDLHQTALVGRARE